MFSAETWAVATTEQVRDDERPRLPGGDPCLDASPAGCSVAGDYFNQKQLRSAQTLILETNQNVPTVSVPPAALFSGETRPTLCLQVIPVNWTVPAVRIDFINVHIPASVGVNKKGQRSRLHAKLR